MKKSKKIWAAVYVLMVACGYANDDLPMESKRLLENFAKYEQKELELARDRIEKKSKAVLGLLKKQLKIRTQNGQLDKALAIRKEIEKLEKRFKADSSNRLAPAEVTFVKGGARSSKTASTYSIDSDSDGGELILVFKHKNLHKLLRSYNKVYLEVTVARGQFADTEDAIILRNEKKTIAKKSKLKQGEVVKLEFEHWKMTRVRDSLTLTIHNSGSDGFLLVGGNGTGSPVLVFGD